MFQMVRKESPTFITDKGVTLLQISRKICPLLPSKLLYAQNTKFVTCKLCNCSIISFPWSCNRVSLKLNTSVDAHRCIWSVRFNIRDVQDMDKQGLQSFKNARKIWCILFKSFTTSYTITKARPEVNLNTSFWKEILIVSNNSLTLLSAHHLQLAGSVFSSIGKRLTCHFLKGSILKTDALSAVQCSYQVPTQKRKPLRRYLKRIRNLESMISRIMKETWRELSRTIHSNTGLWWQPPDQQTVLVFVCYPEIITNMKIVSSKQRKASDWKISK